MAAGWKADNEIPQRIIFFYVVGLVAWLTEWKIVVWSIKFPSTFFTSVRSVISWIISHNIYANFRSLSLLFRLLPGLFLALNGKWWEQYLAVTFIQWFWVAAEVENERRKCSYKRRLWSHESNHASCAYFWLRSRSGKQLSEGENDFTLGNIIIIVCIIHNPR